MLTVSMAGFLLSNRKWHEATGVRTTYAVAQTQISQKRADSRALEGPGCEGMSDRKRCFLSQENVLAWSTP